MSQEPLSASVNNRETLQRRSKDFTEELTNYLQDHFLTFARSKGACEDGRCVEQLVRKWAYLVRFADWSLHEGVINRTIYAKWLIDTVKTHTKDPESEAAWSVMELMLP